ncbi:hypothetical protein [Trichothermofontia sp.]
MPGIYIGSPSISNLYMFLCGYGFSRQEQGLELTVQEKNFEEFQFWVQRRFNIMASVSWAKIILLHSIDERAGFDLFFELLTEFLQERKAKENMKDQLAIARDFIPDADIDDRQLVKAAAQISEPPFAQVWDNPEDEVYNNL